MSCGPIGRCAGYAHPAFFLEEVEEDEAAKEFLGEVADGFIGLGLRFFAFRKRNAEAAAGFCNARWRSELGEEGSVVGVVFGKEFLGEFFY